MLTVMKTLDSQGSNPRNSLQGCSLEGESTEQAPIPPDDVGSSLTPKGESWTEHVAVLGFLPHSAVVMITGEEVHLSISPRPP